MGSWDEADLNEKGESYQQLAKNPNKGRVFARVRPGYIVLNMNWRAGGDIAGVENLKPFGGKKFSAIRASDFTGMKTQSEWWNRYGGVTHAFIELFPEPSAFQETSSKPNWILYSPFDDQEPILTNRDGGIRKTWVAAAATAKKMPLAVVETDGGYFLGYLSESDPLAQSDLTWEAATRTTNANWKLTKTKVEQIQSGKRIFTLNDNHARKVMDNSFNSLDQVRVLGKHLKGLLEGGMAAILAEVTLPRGDGIERPTVIESESTPGIIIEKITDTINVMSDTWNPSTFRFQVAARQRVRESEIKVTAGKTSVVSKPWHKQDRMQFLELSTDLDGGIRFIDGKKIIELIPDRLKKLTLVEWVVEENRLKN